VRHAAAIWPKSRERAAKPVSVLLVKKDGNLKHLGGIDEAPSVGENSRGVTTAY
jgi:hypothetical protein